MVIETDMFSTNRAVELAFAAKRVNGEYLKPPMTPNGSYSNKELILYTLLSESDTRGYVPSGFEPLEVLPEDLENKERADRHMRRYVLLALGNLNQFQSDTFAVYSSEYLSPKKVGFIAYLPYFVERELEELTYFGRVKKEFFKESQLQQADRIEGDFELLKKIPLKEYATFLYFAGKGDNLFVFTNKLDLEVGHTVAMAGKVKEFQVERKTNTPMTKLHYVRIFGSNNVENSK